MKFKTNCDAVRTNEIDMNVPQRHRMGQMPGAGLIREVEIGVQHDRQVEMQAEGGGGRYFTTSVLADNHLSSQICEPCILRAPRPALCRKQMVPGMSSSGVLKSCYYPERRVKEGGAHGVFPTNLTSSASLFGLPA
ncbi:unnamed protein product [Pleuronectes platessa]|uniref:Uncharacterized protein n=1 Tax=Pleuronectes platessa TaxID=8262 RepID=A0A9N7Y4B3_PLEPL|nr:unnamed protein product [Pleuronectes platessa]